MRRDWIRQLKAAAWKESKLMAIVYGTTMVLAIIAMTVQHYTGYRIIAIK